MCAWWRSEGASGLRTKRVSRDEKKERESESRGRSCSKNARRFVSCGSLGRARNSTPLDSLSRPSWMIRFGGRSWHRLGRTAKSGVARLASGAPAGGRGRRCHGAVLGAGSACCASSAARAVLSSGPTMELQARPEPVGLFCLVAQPVSRGERSPCRIRGRRPDWRLLIEACRIGR